MADVGSLDSEQLLVLLQEIGKAADRIKGSVTNMGTESTKHMKSAGEAAAGMDKQIVSMTKNLLGPIGLAAGFAAVTKSLDNFAVGQLQLSNLAKNTSLAASSVLNLQTKFEVAGLGAEGFSRTIGGITSALNNIKTFQEGSQVFGKLSEMLDLKVDGQQIANTVLGFEKIGDRLGAINTLVKGWNQGTERQKLYIEELLHTDRAGMEALQQDIRNVVLVTQQGDAAAKEYHKTWVSVQNTGTNIWNVIANAALEEISRMGGGLEGLKTKSESITKAIAEYFATNLHPAIEREMATIRKLQEFMEYISKLTEGRQLEQGKGPPGALTEKEFLKRQGEDKEPFNFGKWLDEKLGTGRVKPQSLLQGDGGSLELSAKGHSDLIDTEKDSNKLLHDMRDMMQRSEIKTLGGVSGGGSVSAGVPGLGGGGVVKGAAASFGGGAGHGAAGAVPGAEGAQSGKMQLGANKRETAQIVADAWRRAGMSEPGIAGLLANIKSESDFDSTLRHPDQPKWGGEAHFAHGLYQEGGQEWNNYAKWLKQNHPNADWKDPRLQSEFAAKNLKENYPKVWQRMQEGSKEEAAEAYLRGYLKPAAGPMAGRAGQYRRGVPGVEAYEGDRSAGRNLFIDEAQRSTFDKSMRGASVTGELNANVNFSNVPPGVKTHAEGSGFKKLRVTASKQGQKAAEGLNTAGDATYGTWVP